MASIVPLVSSGTAGPLKAIHLPRLWLKLSLANVGKLPDGYDECGAGFDAMTISALNLDRDAVIAYVKSAKPTYVAFEEWVVAQNGGKIDPAAIEAHNAAIRAYNHGPELAAKMRAELGLSDDRVSDAITLNTLEDLDEAYRQFSTRIPA